MVLWLVSWSSVPGLYSFAVAGWNISTLHIVRHYTQKHIASVCVCVCACVRACVRACLCACVRVCVHVRALARLCVPVNYVRRWHNRLIHLTVKRATSFGNCRQQSQQRRSSLIISALILRLCGTKWGLVSFSTLYQKEEELSLIHI